MAALNEIAKEYAEEIRDGIAWVLVWKTSRSWHAEAVWLNREDELEMEDLKRARDVMEQDPDAVMVNGYYCGHFGENMSLAELVAGIRWHYENGCNLLRDSDVFPPAPMERPEWLPDDMPWYGRATCEEPDPYIFDKYMSLEDHERMHELLALDRKQEERTVIIPSKVVYADENEGEGCKKILLSHEDSYLSGIPPGKKL